MMFFGFGRVFTCCATVFGIEKTINIVTKRNMCLILDIRKNLSDSFVNKYKGYFAFQHS